MPVVLPPPLLPRAKVLSLAVVLCLRFTSSQGLKAMADVRVATAELLAKAGKYPLVSEHLGDTSPAQQQYITSRMAVSTSAGTLAGAGTRLCAPPALPAKI